LIIDVGLPLALSEHEFIVKFPPVLVMVLPATMVKVVDDAVKVAPTLLVILAGLPFNKTVEVEPVVIVPELVMEAPACTFNVDAERVKLLVLVVLLIKLGFDIVMVEPDNADTVPELVIFEPPFKVSVDADKEMEPVLGIGAGLFPIIADAAFAVIAPSLVIVVQPPKFKVEPVSVILAPRLFLKVTGLPVLIVD
jgi:hypothetical protein